MLIKKCVIFHKAGFTLIEVLISLLLISCMLIGFDAFCIHSLKGVRNAFYFTEAINQIASMEERLRTLGNHAGFDDQVTMWNLENAKILPQGFGTVSGTYPEYKIQIFWGNIGSTCENNQIGSKGCIKENFEL